VHFYSAHLAEAGLGGMQLLAGGLQALLQALQLALLLQSQLGEVVCIRTSAGQLLLVNTRVMMR